MDETEERQGSAVARLVSIREILAIIVLTVGVVSIGVGGFMIDTAVGFLVIGVALFGLGYLLGSE